jgi:hypothetical protein
MHGYVVDMYGFILFWGLTWGFARDFWWLFCKLLIMNSLLGGERKAYPRG